MRQFTKFIAPALIAVTSLGAIAPGIAEAAPNRHVQAARHYDIRSDIQGLRANIDRAAARRTISQREASGLRRDVVDIQRLYGQYSRGGLSAQETRILGNRVNKVYASLRMERHDYDRRRG
ncbi:hypothetical protein QUC32_12685 [Novosphingobium resinovorum]|uniref:Uncharacterized protein n=1 Tax=Novosphingobium resinovorum TaxID=158500 RepID=A0A1D8A8C0_9SPHN|nr:MULTISPECIES: hypothetical protein [Novosphingobium]AOR78362.1 hypothetical protein BES08_17595 [Novosphingobium resinovorum]MBF7010532.1 hypothetical protein [Novosphingobium sp. HR1a]WJM28532.1 hypothetical protein QUC32_12685 [Novosphingobium resinovorum]